MTGTGIKTARSRFPAATAPSASVAVNKMLETPMEVGIPEIVPVAAEKDKPAGKLEADKETGLPSVWSW